MFGINEILEKAFFKKPLTKEEKFDNLYIEVLGDYKGSLFQLMPIEKLMGWCWQTTKSAIVFLNDDDYIERGYLYIDEDNSERSKNFDKIMKEKTKDEVIVHAPEDVNTPLYRNGAGYKAEIENGKIKKLKVHFYYTDC